MKQNNKKEGSTVVIRHSKHSAGLPSWKCLPALALMTFSFHHSLLSLPRSFEKLHFREFLEFLEIFEIFDQGGVRELEARPISRRFPPGKLHVRRLMRISVEGLVIHI